ncbi:MULTISPECIES: hypothetical protein [unclassified Synechococcus]|jgi:hypothetical protein|uniref:hypothetical protein n=1 Tax=unclassified Synechococcus TaxID=2626047 RepID=UPI0000695198|nr:hypothetical protein [Synechococcus sp. JA-2-3B'a(2-13)]ABD03130.1 conserved hypothetical protein [Synechococcus sp. JA-2-3B'a(2-13)]MDT7945768.1 hypothetical protein [Cyanobacteriota bacterium PSP.bin.10]
MDAAEIAALKERIKLIRERRPAVAKLLEKPDLGSLRVDVNQALEEIDELLHEFEQTFGPES